MTAEEFLLKWNDHQSKIIHIFSELCSEELLVDVTLACEDRTFRAHKLILSACSPYFRKLFISNHCKHPIVFLKDAKSEYVEALLKFMYEGEISIMQNDLMPLIQTAKSLQIKGLTDVASSSDNSSRPKVVESPSVTRESSPAPKRKKISSSVSVPEHQKSSRINETSSDSPEVVPVVAVTEATLLPSSDIHRKQKVIPGDSYISQTQTVSSAEYNSCEYDLSDNYGGDQKSSTEICSGFTEEEGKMSRREENTEYTSSSSLTLSSVTVAGEQTSEGQASTEIPTPCSSHSQAVSEYTKLRQGPSKTIPEYAPEGQGHSQPGTEYTTKRPRSHATKEYGQGFSQSGTEYGPQDLGHSQSDTKYGAERSDHLQIGGGCESPRSQAVKYSLENSTAYQKSSPDRSQFTTESYDQGQVQAIKTEVQDDWSVSGHPLSQLCEPTMMGEQGPSTSVSSLGQLEMPGDPKNAPVVSQVHLCQFCQKSFARKGDMNRHIGNVHFNQRNYTCQVCSKSFQRRSVLTEHMGLHTGTCYKCHRCGRKFPLLRRLQTHQQRCQVQVSPL